MSRRPLTESLLAPMLALFLLAPAWALTALSRLSWRRVGWMLAGVVLGQVVAHLVLECLN